MTKEWSWVALSISKLKPVCCSIMEMLKTGIELKQVEIIINGSINLAIKLY